MSHPRFHVGERARLTMSDLRPELIGCYCEIVEPLRERMMDGPKGKVAQLVYVAKIEGHAGVFGVQEPALAKVFESSDWLDVLGSTGWAPNRSTLSSNLGMQSPQSPFESEFRTRLLAHYQAYRAGKRAP